MTLKHLAPGSAFRMEGAVQGRNATHPGYAHLFKHIAPVAKARRGTKLTNQVQRTPHIAIQGLLPHAACFPPPASSFISGLVL